MISFRCPKCRTVQDGNITPGTAFVICPQCGARLQTPALPPDTVPGDSVSPAPMRPAPLVNPQAPPRPDEWFCTIAGQHRGPYTEADVQRLADREELRPADLVWRTGWPQWRPASQFFQFSEAWPQPRPSSRPRRRRGYDDRDDDDYDRRPYDDRYDMRPPAPGETAAITCGILSIVGGVFSSIPCSFIGIPFGVIGLALAGASLAQGREKTLGGIGLGFSIAGLLMNIGLHMLIFMNGRF